MFQATRKPKINESSGSGISRSLLSAAKAARDK
jgi:hypothetical protein